MSSPLSTSMESILDRFDDAWNGPSPPSIEDYLTTKVPAERLALLVELVQIDLERRLTRGERIRLEETYLPRFPELKADRSSVVSLAVREFELRRRREPRLSSAEYLERWPQYRDELIGRLVAHPTWSTHDVVTHEGKRPADGRQANEETRDVLAFLTPPQAADEMGRLGGYRVLKVLGSGGMGVVFLAEDVQLNRPVALKVMTPGLAANGSARQRFLREARAVAALKHDHIVTIYQVGEDRGVPFLAMEYLEGESLHDRLKRKPELPLAEVLRIGREIADGLAAAHARGLVHRDIKPANIWLETRTERVKLLDFGLARPAGGDDAHLTQTGVILGTPAFMSPEQARGEKVDPRTDLFSLGCVLYRMVTGQRPFKGRDMVSTLLSLANDHPKPARELNPKVPPALNHLIQRLLAKNVADRPSSAQSVAKALQTRADEPEPADLPQPSSSPPRRRRLVPAALTALALLGMTALLAAIIIRIRGKDGRETIIEVPEGSEVTIVAPTPSRDRPGAVAPTFPNGRGSEKPGREGLGALPPLAVGTEALSPWALVRRPARLQGVRSWTIETRKPRIGPLLLAMRPDGRQLAVSSYDGLIRFYDPSTGHVQKALLGQQKSIGYCNPANSLTWSPDGKRLASCYCDGTLHIWNAITGQILRTLHPACENGRCVAWSPDGKLLAFTVNSGLTLWDTQSWQQVPFPAKASDPRHLAWSPDSKMLATVADGLVVLLLEVPSGKLLHRFDGFKGLLSGLAWSPEGTTLATAGMEKELRLWDVPSGKLRRTVELQASQSPAAFSPDGKILALSMSGRAISVQLFDTTSWKLLRQLWPGSKGHICSLAWSPDGATLAVVPYGSHISHFKVSTGKEVRRIEAHGGNRIVGENDRAWCPDGKKIAAMSWAGLRIWDADSGKQPGQTHPKPRELFR